MVASSLRIWCFSIQLQRDGIFPSMVLIKKKLMLTSEHWGVMALTAVHLVLSSALVRDPSALQNPEGGELPTGAPTCPVHHCHTSVINERDVQN